MQAGYARRALVAATLLWSSVGCGDPDRRELSQEEIVEEVVAHLERFAGPVEQQSVELWDEYAAARHRGATIPFVMNRGHIVVGVDVGGRELKLALDNGNVRAPTILYGSSKIDSLALDFTGEARVRGAGDGPAAAARVSSPQTLRLGDVELPGQTLVVMAYDPALLQAFDGEDGVIGGAIWDNFVVEIDFERSVLVLSDPDGFSGGGRGRSLELGYLADGGSTVTGTVTLVDGTEIPGVFHLDLGSPTPLSLNLGTHRDLQRPETTVERQAFGSQGAFTEHVGRVRRLRLGAFELEGVIAAFVTTPSLSEMGNLGSIGSEVFQRFHVTLDYTRDRLFLEPNTRFEGSFELDMSGLGLLRTETGHFQVVRVQPGSPASDARLTEGDVVARIDGRSTRDMSYDEIRAVLRKEGGMPRLEVVRNGARLSVTLRLRRPI